MPYSCQSTMTHAGSKQKIEHTLEKIIFRIASKKIEPNEELPFRLR